MPARCGRQGHRPGAAACRLDLSRGRRSGRHHADHPRHLQPGRHYARLDIVALNSSSFIARKDQPGPCPGEDWQLIVRAGKQGRPGPRGAKGERGEPGSKGRDPARLRRPSSPGRSTARATRSHRSCRMRAKCLRSRCARIVLIDPTVVLASLRHLGWMTPSLPLSASLVMELLEQRRISRRIRPAR
jgi:hypothetical protein